MSPMLPASSTPSLTLTPSFGSSPAATSTSTPTLPPSPTQTQTQTATPTPLCAAPAGAPQPFQPSSLVVLRLGNGQQALSSSAIAREAFLDEYSPFTNALLQTIALPTGPAVLSAGGSLLSAGCTLTSSTVNTGLMTRSADGLSLVIACLPENVGATIGAAGNKTIMRVNPDGSVVPNALMTGSISSTGVYSSGGLAATIFGAATDTGNNTFFTTSSGPLWIPAGRVGAAQVASTTAATGGMAFPSGGWAFAVRSTSIAVLGLSTSTSTP